MNAKTDSPNIFILFSRWLHARMILLELITVLVLMLLMYINVRSGSELGWIIIFPLAFLMLAYFFLRQDFKRSKGIPLLIFLINTYAAEAALFAFFSKYLAWPLFNMFLQSAALLLGVSLIGIFVLKMREQGSPMFRTSDIVRTILLELIMIVLIFTPNEYLTGLGFALAL